MKNPYQKTIYACYLGYITQAIINNLAPLLFVIFQDKFNISYSQLGQLILMNFGTQLIVDILAIKFVDKIGYRRSCLIAHGCAALGLVMLGILPNILDNSYAGLLLAATIYAIGGGLIEVLISPIVESCPGEAKAAAMSLLHSFYCWGQVAVVAISTLLLLPLGTDYWFVLPLLWAIIPVLNFFNFMKVPFAPMVSEEERIPLKDLLKSKGFKLAMVLMICAGASELAMSQWSSLFAERGLGVSKVLGDLLGACLFAVCMGIGRTIYGIYGDRINLKKALTACAALCIICYMVTALVSIPFISLAACALTGFAVSLMWPGMFSLSIAKFPAGGTALFAILAMCGDIGCASGPWITGIVSDLFQKTSLFSNIQAATLMAPEQLGIKAGLLVAVIFPIIMFVSVSKFHVPE